MKLGDELEGKRN